MKAYSISTKTNAAKWMIVIFWFVGATVFANVAYANVAYAGTDPVRPGKKISKKGLYGKTAPIKRNLKKSRPTTYRTCH